MVIKGKQHHCSQILPLFTNWSSQTLTRDNASQGEKAQTEIFFRPIKLPNQIQLLHFYVVTQSMGQLNQKKKKIVFDKVYKKHHV